MSYKSKFSGPEIDNRLTISKEVRDALNAEITARTEADSTLRKELTTTINTEASTRADADTNLQAQINNLSTATTNAVTLRGRVATVEALPTTASIGDLYLVGEEGAEEYDEYLYTTEDCYSCVGRAGVTPEDYVCKPELSEEITARTEGDEALQDDIDGLTDRVDDIDSVLNNSINLIKYDKILFYAYWGTEGTLSNNTTLISTGTDGYWRYSVDSEGCDNFYMSSPSMITSGNYTNIRVNPDKSITLSGKQGQYSPRLALFKMETPLVKGKSYVFSGFPTEGSNIARVNMFLVKPNPAYGSSAVTTIATLKAGQESVQFTAQSSNISSTNEYYVTIAFPAWSSEYNMTLKPMLVEAANAGAPYQPYGTLVDSVDELKSNVSNINTWIGNYTVDTEISSTSTNPVENKAVYELSTNLSEQIKTAIESIGNPITVKGVKATVDELPTTDNKIGDLWFVGTLTATTDSYTEYVWTSQNTWEYMGKVQTDVDLSDYATIVYVNEEIAEVASRVSTLEGSSHTHSNADILNATTASYTSAEKSRLAGIEENANKTVVDSALSDSSENPVQNKVINAAMSSISEQVDKNTEDIGDLNGKLAVGTVVISHTDYEALTTKETDMLYIVT